MMVTDVNSRDGCTTSPRKTGLVIRKTARESAQTRKIELSASNVPIVLAKLST